MPISSRTPEGTPNRCPLCGLSMCIEASEPLGDAPCPHCGSLLWFVAVGDETRFFDPNQPGLVEKMAEGLGIDPEALREGRWKELGIDSLDLWDVMIAFDERNEG